MIPASFDYVRAVSLRDALNALTAARFWLAATASCR
jgi:hypothetical protein